MRFRHTAAEVKVQPGSLLAQQMAAGLPQGHRLQDGYVVVVFGGYNTLVEEFGGSDLDVSCARPASSASWDIGSRQRLLFCCRLYKTECCCRGYGSLMMAHRRRG